MSPARAKRRVAIGVSAHLGWAATAVIAVGKDAPRILRTERLELTPGDREATEPYHVSGGFHGLRRVPRPPDPEAALKRNLTKQRQSVRRATAKLERELARTGHRIAFVGILVSRGRRAASFEQAVGSHTQVHIEEGIAVRESIRRALAGEGRRLETLDQKTVWSTGSEELGRSEKKLGAELGALRPDNGGPWRKEEKTAALAAWIAWNRGAR